MKKGFTVIELVISVALFAITLLALMPWVTAESEFEKIRNTARNAGRLILVIEEYHRRTCNQSPFVQPTTANLITSGLLQDVPTSQLTSFAYQLRIDLPRTTNAKAVVSLTLQDADTASRLHKNVRGTLLSGTTVTWQKMLKRNEAHARGAGLGSVQLFGQGC